MGFPGGASSKEPACGRHKRYRFDLWVGKIPWRGEWQPTPVFLPGKSMNRGAWWATVHGVAKSQAQLSVQHTYILYIYIYNLPHILIIYVSVYTHTHTHTQLPHVALVHAGRPENQENK